MVQVATSHVCWKDREHAEGELHVNSLRDIPGAQQRHPPAQHTACSCKPAHTHRRFLMVLLALFRQFFFVLLCVLNADCRLSVSARRRELHREYEWVPLLGSHCCCITDSRPGHVNHHRQERPVGLAAREKETRRKSSTLVAFAHPIPMKNGMKPSRLISCLMNCLKGSLCQ